MQILYNSENFSIVQFDVEQPGSGPISAAATVTAPATTQALGASSAPPPSPLISTAAVASTEPAALTYGGFEIVDKFARKETFLHGAMAEAFKEGVQALIATRPSEEEIDDYLERFTSLMQQPVVMH